MTINSVIKKTALEAVRQSQPTSITLGAVTSVTPLTIETDQKLILSREFLVLTRNLTDYETTIKTQDGLEQEVTIMNCLQAGERVIMIREAGGQRYFVIDRIGEDDE